MATTTNYSWTTPDDTALVKDGAAAIRSLGTAIDSTVFTNASAVIAKTIVDAKGDIIAATAADTVSRLAVGTNNQVLTADSTAATGIKWATPAVSYPIADSAKVATEQITSSTTYTDLTTAGPAITMTTGTKALVIITCAIEKGTNLTEGYASYAVSGATTIAASDTVAVGCSSEQYFRLSAVSRLTTLTAGSNTFTMKYRSASGNGYFKDREIIVIDLGS